MEPEVRFCTSADGTRLAYWTLGEGPPQIGVLPWAHNLEMEWEDPAFRTFCEKLARGRKLVTPMNRGAAASQREVSDISLEALVSDVVAVADQVAREPADLFGVADASPVAIAFAARYPERVRRLILWTPFAYGPDIRPPEQWRAFIELIRSNWSLARRMMAGGGWPNGPVETQRRFSTIVRESISPETAAKYFELQATVDVRDLLPQIEAPTLVFSRRNSRSFPTSAGRAVAAGIPNSRFLVLEGDTSYTAHGDLSWIDTAFDFLDKGRQIMVTNHASTSEPAAPAGMTAILFADIVDSTALTERLGDAAFRAKARELDGALRTVIRDHGGTCIDAKTLGDGVLAVFTSARQAIEAALACARSGDEAGLPLHLGLHAGDVIREEGNVYGGAVNIAARISGLSAAGEVLVSETVRSLARTSAGVWFEDRGEQALKGVGEAVRVWAVREGEA